SSSIRARKRSAAVATTRSRAPHSRSGAVMLTGSFDGVAGLAGCAEGMGGWVVTTPPWVGPGISAGCFAQPSAARPVVCSRCGDCKDGGMRIVVLAGGIGGARFLAGVRATGEEVTAVVNVGDDVTLHGLRICPDLDSVMYTLGGGADRERGWGRAGETWVVKEELAAYGAEPAWFGLGDRDLATHLVRTRMIGAGYPLSAVTEALCARWQPGVRLIPMTDDRVETHVLIDDPDAAAGAGARKAVHFQEYWVRLRAGVQAHAVVPVGAETAKPAPGVLEAIGAADVIV